MHALLDAWVVVRVPDVSVVYGWREEAEARARARGQGAMSREEVVDFVARYMPAYGEYLPRLYADMRGEHPEGVGAGKPRLAFAIDRHRRPTEADGEEPRRSVRALAERAWGS
mmetsp:Transcript_5944/g.20241  ORF Transcript_5944/g.20241 Transcript_5944/m.20241 type:complete len:113 (+) Transcript_5944:1-339(+)